MARPSTAVGSVMLAISLSACGETGSRLETVEPLPRSLAPETSSGVSGTEVEGQPSRRGEGPESILEFGLFGPVVPALGNDSFEVDCRFGDGPFGTCL